MISYFEKQLDEMKKSIQSMDEDAFRQLVDEAVEAQKSGRKVIVSGLGKNVPICEKFVGTMVSMGLNASFLHTNSAVHGDMGIVKKGDVLILLTKSGETEESVYLHSLLKNVTENIWLLTFEKDSTLGREINKQIVLSLEHEGDLWNIMPNNSTTLNLIVLQGLAMEIAKKMDIQIDDFKRNHPGGHIGALLKENK